MARLTFIVLAASVLRSWAVSTLRRSDTKRNFNVKVIREFDHEEKPFTQGLEYDPDTNTLIETSGSFPEGTKSFIRSIDPATGKTLWKKEDGLTGAFVEGITRTNGHWFASVYQEPRKALEYDSNFKYVRNHSYYFDGWGLTRTPDDKAFLATNGSSTVMKLDQDFKLLESKVAMCHGKPVPGLNELEMVRDFQGTKKPALLGNVYTSRIVLALDPDTMECTGAFHLEGLSEPFESGETSGYHVANGIAYRPESDTFFVTGKNWNKMFEVKLEEEHIATNSAFTKLAEWQESQHTAPGLGLIQLGQPRPVPTFTAARPDMY
jgi:glutamine cyclotransferase